MAYNIVDGYFVSEDLDPTYQSIRTKITTFTASATITVGQWVNLDYSKTSNADKLSYVTVTDTSGGAVAIGVPSIGVAVTAAAADEPVDVCVAGFCPAANVATGSTSGLALALDTTTSGRATIADAANVNLVGIALANAVDNSAPVIVLGYGS